MPQRRCRICRQLYAAGSPCCTRRQYTSAERGRRAEAVDAWRERYGDVCPGWNRPPHRSTDLTADHVIAVGAGGREDGELAVLCRSCNGAKADRR